METKPSSLANTFRSVAIIIAAAVIFSPLSAQAETIIFTQSAAPQQSAIAPTHNKLRLALDDDGNVMVRFMRVSLTFIYEAGGAPDNQLQSSVTTSRQEVACLGGLSVKFGLTF
jgi:hypothetical protein